MSNGLGEIPCVDASGFKYDLALSFAGEDRAYVEKVVQRLRVCDLTFFYDTDEEVELWGKDLFIHLDDVYRKQARFCVMFISKSYKEKLWTKHERKSALARAFTQDEEYVLPARFDDTEIPGILPTTGYVDLRRIAPNELGDLIKKKVDTSRTRNTQEFGSAPEFSLPRLPKVGFDVSLERKKIVDEVEVFLDTRVKSLSQVGITCRKTKSAEMGDNYPYFVRYYFSFRGEEIYRFDAWRSSHCVGFYDGNRMHHNPDVEATPYTAMLYLHSDANLTEPRLEIINPSLLSDFMLSSGSITKPQLLEGIWKKLISTFEGLCK